MDEGLGVPAAAAVAATRTRSILDTLVDPLVLLAPVRDAGGRVVDLEYVEANAAACEFEGRDYEHTVGARMLQIHPGNREAGTFDNYVRVLETGEPFAVDDVVYQLEGSGDIRVFDVRAARADDLVSLTWRDATARHQQVRELAESEQRYRLLAQNSSDVVMLSLHDSVTWVSPSLERMLGWTPAEWVGRPLSEFACPEGDPNVLDVLQALESGEQVVLRVRFCDKERVPHWVELHAQTYVGANGMPDGVQSSFRTVDNEVAYAAALERLARFDTVTGALNRHEAIAVIEALSSRRRRPTDQFAVLFCDIDRFKDINDTHGHAAGDAVLRVLAQRIGDTVRREDRVARYGGDEFVILLDGVHDLTEAAEIAEKIRSVALEPVGHEGMTIAPTVSIGVTVARPGESVELLLRRADAAMYAAKGAGRNRVVAIGNTDGPQDRDTRRRPDGDQAAATPEAASATAPR